MNTTSASPAERRDDGHAGARPPRRVLVWDAPVRLFHALMVLSFAGAYLTAESERWRLVHVTLGYTMAGLVAFRVVWGLIGSRHARFTSFVRGPVAVVGYLRSLLRRQPRHFAGHNPAGAVVIVGLLGLALVVTGAGWALLNDVGPGWLEEVHEAAAHVMLAIVGLHVAGVVVSSWLHRDNLIGAMLTGRKLGRPEDAVRSAWRSVAALMLVAVLGFWFLQWQGAAGGTPSGTTGGLSAVSRSADRDDD